MNADQIDTLLKAFKKLEKLHPGHAETRNILSMARAIVRAANAPAVAAITPEMILHTIFETLGISAEQVRSKARPTPVVEARVIYCHFANELCRVNAFQRLTMEQIGEAIAKDHGTVCHALKRYQAWHEVDPAFRSKADAVAAALTATQKLQEAA